MTTIRKSATVKVMLSHNYNHFEASIALENDEGVTVQDIDSALLEEKQELVKYLELLLDGPEIEDEVQAVLYYAAAKELIKKNKTFNQPVDQSTNQPQRPPEQ